jgi:magnesium-transporting ATPase (P-type)
VTLQGLEDALKQFASEGLRTLVVAKRELSFSEVEPWLRAYKEASGAVGDRERCLADVAAVIETDLMALGASAIEDRLQVTY